MDAPEVPNPLDLPEEQQVVYELGEWPLDLQASAAEAMAESGIPHAWDGTDLVVHVDAEDSVDELLDVVERSGGGVDEDADSDGEIAYELDEWSEQDRAALSERLTTAAVAYRWEDDTTLVVVASDEELVESVLDDIEAPDALAAEAPDEDTDVADETSFEVLSSLYLAADRLQHDPLDADGIADLSSAVEEADPSTPPYGIEAAVWQAAIGQANAMADALSADDPDTKAIAGQAARLRTLLRPYV
jgi:hypothetical protein